MILRLAPVPRKWTLKQGGFLNTLALPPLTPAECNELTRIQSAVIAENAREAGLKRRQWREKRKAELVARGVDPTVADKALGNAVEHHSLDADFFIRLDDGSDVTVREILAKPSAFHRKTCADPLEPDYGGGRNKAIIYADASPIRIHSQAHGGIVYRLERAPMDFFEAIPGGAEEWPEPVDIFGDGDPATLTEVPAGALPAIILKITDEDVAALMGVPVIFAALGVSNSRFGGC